MSAFVLKIIACISMFTDHLGYAIFGKLSFFNYIGRLAFPIFAFQIAEGYSHTKDLKKYFIRLGIFALISQLPFMMFYSIISTNFLFNIIFTLILGLIGITIYDKYNKVLGIIATILLGGIAQHFNFDYGFFGVAVIMIFYMFRDKKLLKTIFFILAVLIHYGNAVVTNYPVYLNWSILSQVIALCLLTISSIAIILLYNGQKGKDSKYLFYLFYPLHLLVIYYIWAVGQ